jgi:hypothetical protein
MRSETRSTEAAARGTDAPGVVVHGERGRLVVSLSVALFALGAYAIFSYPAHHDVAWLLYVAGELLNGSSLYTDVVETNPPLIVWFSVPAAGLARMFGAWDVFVYRALVLCTVAVSILLCRRQLRGFETRADSTPLNLMTLLLGYVFVVGVGFDFGQREHLAIILVFPYFILTARQIAGIGAASRQDVIAGVLAGFGFAIKPHFVLAWLGLEVYTLLRRRRVVATLPQLAVVIVFALYGVAVLLFERDYLQLVRLGANVYVNSYQVSAVKLLQLPPALWAIAAAAVAFLVPLKSPLRELCRFLGIAVAGFLVVVIVQAKGWGYHWIPATTIAAVVIPLVLWSWLYRLLPRDRLAGAGTALAAGLGVFLLVLSTSKFNDADVNRRAMQGKAYLLPQMIDVLERHAQGGPVAALSTNMQAAFPLVNYTDVKWALRFNSLWLLPGVYPDYEPGSEVQYHRFEQMPEAERYMFDAVIDDLSRQQPTVLIVDTTPPGYVLRGFDYLTYFGRDARFAALMRSYHEVAPVERYRIFVRD